MLLLFGDLNVERSEHLQWCKDRAMEYINDNNVTDGIASFISDMSKHPETEGHSALTLMSQLMFSGHLNTASEAGKFIQGFN